MGYRSDVCFGMNDDVWAALKVYVELINNKELTDLVWLHVETSFDENNNKLFWSGIKWYEGYEDIDHICRFINQLNDSNSEFGFLRIGEDSDDFDELGDPCEFDIFLNRTIGW